MSIPNNNSRSNGITPPDCILNEKHIYICDMPLSKRKQLCDYLDELNVWTQLAQEMRFSAIDIQSINRQCQLHRQSPNEQLLKIWGNQYNHNITELFVLLYRLKLYEAMRIIKDFVSRKHQLRIPNSKPAFSKILPYETYANDNQTIPEHSRKLQNIYGLHMDNNMNNILDTSDNNMTTTTSSNNTWRSRSHSAGQTDASNSVRISENSIKKYASCILEINYYELADATQGWSEDYILGKGGFGTVFRGYWKHTEVAIKRIHYRGANGRENAKIQIQQSLNELKYLNSCRHDNILPLYGYSIKGEYPCLVYQLMKGGSLEMRLNSKKFTPLTWQQRINICLGTARGINYLHTFRDKPLIHGDIKPANVLLGQCLEAKIGDFGLAREGPNAVKSTVEVTQVFGTKPYLPPEFLNSRKLSTQVDTYSFGVVLLEVFTGLRVYDTNRSDPLLTKHILRLYAKCSNQLQQLIDQRIPLQTGEEDFCKRCIQLGIECIAGNPEQRPEMEQVLQTIGSSYKPNDFL